jgi:glycosyl transferase family 87
MISTPVSSPTRQSPYYVKALAMAIPALMLGFQISGWIFFAASIRDGHPDFRANYTAGYLVRTGHARDVYNYDVVKKVQDAIISHEVVGMPFIHPAYEALLFAPYALLGFHAAYFAFLGTNLLILFLCFRALEPKLESLAQTWPPIPAAVLITFLPVAAALMQEQDSILLLGLLTVAAAMLDEGKEFKAGCIVGLGLFRLQLVFPIAAAFILWRRWRFAAGFALVGVLVLSASVWVAGITATKAYLGQLASMSYGGTPLERIRYYQPITHMGNLRAFVFGVTRGWLSSVWVQVVTIVLSAAVMLWLLVFTRYAKGSQALLVAITASIIVSYHCFIHDMSILVLPVALALSVAFRSWAHNTPDKLLALGSAIMFTAPVLIVWASFHFYFIFLAQVLFLYALMRSFRRYSPPTVTESVP